MKIIRRTNILVKTKREYRVYRQAPEGEVVLCPRCGGPMFEAQTAAEILGTSVREAYRMVETGALHFYENDEQTGFFCVSGKPGDTH